jgi:hypothetical protein
MRGGDGVYFVGRGRRLVLLRWILLLRLSMDIISIASHP